jgi:hypothetical protein
MKPPPPNVARVRDTISILLSHLPALRKIKSAPEPRHYRGGKRAEALLSDMVGLIAKHLKKGNRLRLVGLGISPFWQFTPGRGEHGRTIPLPDMPNPFDYCG